jgi:hypothetical protein
VTPGSLLARPAVPVYAGHTGLIAVLIPLAHVGHWLWVLYLPPVLIVVGSILRTRWKERRSPPGDPPAAER